MNEKKDTIKDNDSEIEIVTGDGKNLDISPVFDHIKMDTQDKKDKKDKKIVIPKSKE